MSPQRQSHLYTLVLYRETTLEIFVDIDNLLLATNVQLTLQLFVHWPAYNRKGLVVGIAGLLLMKMAAKPAAAPPVLAKEPEALYPQYPTVETYTVQQSYPIASVEYPVQSLFRTLLAWT